MGAMSVQAYNMKQTQEDTAVTHNEGQLSFNEVTPADGL